jgi:aspartate beta-hydroxylase
MSLTYDAAVDVFRSIYDRAIATPAILDSQRYFPHAPLFVAQWQEIRDEALAAAASLSDIPRFHDIMPQQADISANDGKDWRMLILKAYNVAMPDNLNRFPAVARLLAQSPEVVSCVVSFLAPGKHIPVHRGPFRGILRFHLMLSMPRDETGQPACVMEVDSVPYRLAAGDSLLWDDTYPHEVWNRSADVRIALLLDVWRPDMAWHLRALSWLVLRVVQAGLRMKATTYAA